MTDTTSVAKISRTVTTFSFINGSINLMFDKPIERYVKIGDSGDPEKDFNLQESNTLSKFEGEIIKALSKNRSFALTYNLAKTLAGTARQNDNEIMLAKANDIKSKAISFALSGCTMTMTYKDVPKGTEEEYIDTLDGQKKKRQSLRNKRQFDIEDVKLDDFSNKLLMQLLLQN